MTRKSVRFPSGLRRGPWKTNLVKRDRDSDEKNTSRSIFVSASYAERWSSLKAKFRFKSDSDLVDYLLTLGEAQPKPSVSPDDESDDGWCPPIRTGRKKRGPSLRAVLRRSNRKPGSKSDFISDSIESEESQSEKSNHSEDDSAKRKFSEHGSKNMKYNDYKDIPKNRFESHTDSKKSLNNDKEKEAKAHQLDAELALIVESVDLQPHKGAENEMYEFKDETPPLKNNGLPSGSPSAVNVSNPPKIGHKRWKSYHKDKRKWKQSYAAVVPEEEDLEELKAKEEELAESKSEKERKIFKSLKKNRILTAYLNSQNKIADACKDSKGDDEKVLIKDLNEKTEEQSQSITKKVVDADDIDSDDSKSKEDATDVQNFEKGDVCIGKENQGKASTTSESVVIEVGERVKLKKRKKKLLQDSEETSSNHIEDNRNTRDGNTTEPERHHKLKRNWKKSIIDYELEGKEPQFKSLKVDDAASSSFSNIQKDSVCESELNTTELGITPEEGQRKEDHSEFIRLVSQEHETSEPDNDTSLGTQCSQCYLKHLKHPCPVQNPLQVVEDSMTYEQWQLQCQVHVRCSVIEPPRQKSGRLKKAAPGSPISSDIERRNRDIENNKVDDNTRLYAEESLPGGLGLQVISEEHGKSIVCKSSVAQFTQFGPLVGPRVHEKDISDESDMKHIWEVLEEKVAIYLNTEDPQKSNWLRFMRPAPERHDRNITLTVKNKQLYFVSTVEIPEGEELLYWADDHLTSWSKKKILKSSCGGCNMRFAHPLYYRRHCAVFHDPFHSLTIRKYHCKVCGEAVMGKENIMKHAADLHEGRGAYQCQYCHKFFLRLNYLEMHRTYGCSSNPHRTRPLCDFCGRYFCQPQKLKVHIKRMHSDMSEVLKEFQCKSCLKILGSRAALQRHFKEVHHRDVVVASNCDRCGKSFQNRSNLKIHMLTHSGVKPFRCQQEGCSAAFTTKQCLQFHYKKAHGLSEDALPRIERSIAYTFDAYAGEAANGVSKTDKEQMKKPPKLIRKARKASAKSQKNRGPNVSFNQGGNLEENVDSPPAVPVAPVEPEATDQYEPPQVTELSEPHSYPLTTDSVPVPEPSLPHPDSRCPLSPTGLAGLPFDDAQLGDTSVLTPLRAVATVATHVEHRSADDYHPQHIGPVRPCQPCTSPRPSSPNHDYIHLQNKGHKRWLGEVIEVAEEAAAAAMRLSPRLSPHSRRDIYDFDENKVKSKIQYMEASVRQELQLDVGLGRSRASTALASFHHPESASMLVEAALDAAERDICCPSVPSRLSPNPVSMSRSPEPPHLSQATYCVRSPHHEEDEASTTYYNSAPASDHYSVNLHPLDSYSAPPSHMSPSRLYIIPSHQVHPHEAIPQGPPSSDDEVTVDPDCAQNLSLSGKNKAQEQSDSSMFTVHPDLAHHAPSSGYPEHLPLPQQNDLNYSGTMVVSPPHYLLYDLSPDRQRSDVSVTDLTVSNRGLPQEYTSYEDISGSVDLSVNRDHGHGHSYEGQGHSVHTSPPPSYSTSLAHQYAAPASHCVPVCSTHPPPYQSSPLQRPHISSSTNSPRTSPSPVPAHYHSYPPYY